MNQPQKIAVALGAVILILMVLCPPWIFVGYNEAGRIERPAGYAILFLPPWTANPLGIRIDFGRLALQAIGVCLLTGLTVWAAKEKNG